MLHSRRFLVSAFLVFASLILALPAFASAAGFLEAETDPLVFPDTGIHGPSTTQSTKITNGGDENVFIGGIGASLPFSIDAAGTDCDDMPIPPFGSPLAPGSSCNLVVRFNPSVLGPSGASVVIPYTDLAENPKTLEITSQGNGVTGTLSADPPAFTPLPYYFGGSQQLVNVNNLSPYTVVGGNATIGGPDAAAFNVNSSNCNGNLLQPGNNCSLNVQFSPSGPGVYVAQLEISNDGTADPLIVPLQAEALSGPKAVITPPEIDFGPIEVGTAATGKQVAISNAGDFPLEIQQLLIFSGTPQNFPISGDNCSGQVINPGAKCEVTVGFAPIKGGERNASIFVITNTPGPVTISSLTGEGMFVPDGTVDLTSQAQVGVPIVCLTSGYRDVDALSFQWLRGGVAIAGETQSIYVPVEADIGASLSCEVTAVNPVGTQTVTSAPSPTVVAAASGPQGPAGGTGPQGAAGPAGAKGDPGTTGPQGKTGKRGPKGKPGKSKPGTCKSRAARSAKAKKKCAAKHSRGGHR